MKVLIDLGHPAHYHFYKNTIKHLSKQNDEILIVVRNREGMVADLLKADGLSYFFLSSPAKGLMMKAFRMITNEVRLLRIASRFKPDLFLSMSSPYSAHVSLLMRRPHISFGDTETAKLAQVILAPLWNTKTFLPNSFHGSFNLINKVTVDSYKEITYLHPNYFKPDQSVLKEVGLEKDEKFVIVRFSSFDASHDIGLKGLSVEAREKLVIELSRVSKVFVTSEVKYSPILEPYKLVLNPAKMHDILAYAALYVGEGAVMASEAATLGIPSIFINPSKRGFLDELERHGLLIQIHDANPNINDIIGLCKKLLSDSQNRNELQKKRNIMITSKIDLTSKIISEIESYRSRIGR